MSSPRHLSNIVIPVALAACVAGSPANAGAPNSLALANGSDDTGYVRVADAPGLDLQQFTIDVRFRPDGPGLGNTFDGVGSTIIAKPREGAIGSFIFSWSLNWSPQTNRVVALVSNNGSTVGESVESTSIVPEGTSVRATFTFNGETIRLYLNGCLDAEVTTQFTSVYDGDDDLLIGAANYGLGFLRRFEGRIDEVTIWSEALEESQINDLDPSQAGAELVGWWTFDGGSLADQSGNGNDGTASGTVAFAAPIPLNACDADLNDDGEINLADLNLVLGSFGEDTCFDATGDGTMDLADLNAVLAGFGTPCP